MKEINAIQSSIEDDTRVGWNDWDVRITVPHIPLNVVKADQDQITKASEAIVHTNDVELDYGQLIGILTHRMQETAMMRDSESIMIEEKYEDSNLQPKQEKTKKESTTLSPGTTPWGTAKNEDTPKRKV
jgi:hypothetical protein